MQSMKGPTLQCGLFNILPAFYQLIPLDLACLDLLLCGGAVRDVQDYASWSLSIGLTLLSLIPQLGVNETLVTLFSLGQNLLVIHRPLCSD